MYYSLHFEAGYSCVRILISVYTGVDNWNNFQNHYNTQTIYSYKYKPHIFTNINKLFSTVLNHQFLQTQNTHLYRSKIQISLPKLYWNPTFISCFRTRYRSITTIKYLFNVLWTHYDPIFLNMFQTLFFKPNYHYSFSM